MPTAFHCIGIIGKQGDPQVQASLRALADFLRRRHRRIVLDEATAQAWPEERFEHCQRGQLGSDCDLVIVMGGDGTLLNAARSLADFGVPLLGVNLGRLGFLTDVSPSEMLDALEEILEGHYLREERFLLHARIRHHDELRAESYAFNDVVLHKWDAARMIEFETYVDDQFVYSQRSDGLIVSTPTGSTAYALSGGGPILHPKLDALVLVPICPHTLSARPIVVTGDSRVEIVVSDANDGDTRVTCDGQVNFRLQAGDRLQIARKEQTITLIQPTDHNYYGILRAKLHWGRKVT
jgi:NAD+ kinase